jgi:beta-lactamase class A
MEAALTRAGTVRPPPRSPLLPAAGALLAAGLLTSGLVVSAPRASCAEDLPAKEADLLAKLHARVKAVDARLDGVLGVCVRDLATGATVDLRPDEVFPTASSIKLAVLYELYRQQEEGRVDLDEVVRPPLPRVGGGGVLWRLGGQVSLTWRDLAVLTHVWSDNEAANTLVRRVGMDAVNRRLDSLGLTRTRLRRQMMDIEAARRGEENVSTPRELARLADLVGRAEGLAASDGRDLLAVAALPDSGSSFRRGLPEGVRAVSKAGELEGVRCDAGWVDVPGRPYSAAIMTTYLRNEADGEAAIAEISTAIYATFDRLGRSSEFGRAIGSSEPHK